MQWTHIARIVTRYHLWLATRGFSMRISFAPFAFAAITAALPAHADPASILAANRTASGTWDGKATLLTEDAYSGQGMTGKATTSADLKNGYWADSYTIGPASGANGFDGAHAWQKDQSGTVTIQDGGDQRPLAVNEAYRRANLWWRPGFGGAVVVEDGTKSEGGARFDVLTITPKDGESFDAWFDARTHLLARTVEKQGAQTVSTTLSD
jgi:hypothetical protein